VHKYISKNEKVWQTEVKAIYINYIQCHFGATLCLFSVACCYYVCYGEVRM